MIDLHCHLLPGVDDGASNNADSIELFERAIADGITHMVLTPHVHPGRYENNKTNINGITFGHDALGGVYRFI